MRGPDAHASSGGRDLALDLAGRQLPAHRKRGFYLVRYPHRGWWHGRFVLSFGQSRWGSVRRALLLRHHPQPQCSSDLWLRRAFLPGYQPRARRADRQFRSPAAPPAASAIGGQANMARTEPCHRLHVFADAFARLSVRSGRSVSAAITQILTMDQSLTLAQGQGHAFVPVITDVIMMVAVDADPSRVKHGVCKYWNRTFRRWAPAGIRGRRASRPEQLHVHWNLGIVAPTDWSPPCRAPRSAVRTWSALCWAGRWRWRVRPPIDSALSAALSQSILPTRLRWRRDIAHARVHRYVPPTRRGQSSIWRAQTASIRTRLRSTSSRWARRAISSDPG